MFDDIIYLEIGRPQTIYTSDGIYYRILWESGKSSEMIETADVIWPYREWYSF
jgi:hypothetical protein